MTTKELIREKIDAFYAEYKAKFHQNGDSYHLGIIDGLDIAERILDTLPDGPVTDCHDLKKHTKEWVELMVGASFPEQDGDFISEEDYRDVIKKTAIHFAEWGAEHLAGVRKMISDDLGEAAIDFADNARKALYSKDYAISSIADYDHGCIDGFKAGAEWQKAKMMEGAVEGTVIELGETYKDLSLSVNAKELNQVLQPLGVGDGNKVKIIIVKEEEQ